MIDQSQTKAFLAGVFVATTTFFLLHIQNKSTNNINNNITQRIKKNNPTQSSTNTPENEQDETNNTATTDSPTLPLRIIRKAETAIIHRTSRILVVIERCTNDFNYSAILRTVEALGIQHVWLIAPTKPNEAKQQQRQEQEQNLYKSSTGQIIKRVTQNEISARCNHHLFAKKATEWLTIREFETTSECIRALRQDRRTIWVTDLSQHAIPLTRESFSPQDIPDRLAIVFGTEAVGCSNEFLNSGDKRVYLPLYGFADSLNLSVATALCLYQLFCLEPGVIGHMSETERQELRQTWYVKLASQRILTSAQKRHRSKLQSKLMAWEELERKQDSGEELDRAQLRKLLQKPDIEKQLHQIEAEIHTAAKLAVKELVQNPPEPLKDMRRADEHRTCYVGKNTKKKYCENWKDMPATANFGTDGKVTTSKFFREKAEKEKG